MSDNRNNTAPQPPQQRQSGGHENSTQRPRIRLPFDNRPTDAGVWAYDHRIGLAVTVVAYLVIAIAFVGGKIAVSGRQGHSTILVDLQDIGQLEAERERLQREVERRQQELADWQSIQNRSSNENALNENLKDDRGTRTDQLNRSAEEAERRMQANREEYERGLAEAQALGERRDDSNRLQENTSSKAAGRVTVSYSLNNPVRHHVYLDKPAYKCEGGGEVVVNITVDRNGKVIDASVVSGGDACMRETALHSAKISTFNIDTSAPAKQNGTITYIFIPQ